MHERDLSGAISIHLNTIDAKFIDLEFSRSVIISCSALKDACLAETGARGICIFEISIVWGVELQDFLKEN